MNKTRIIVRAIPERTEFITYLKDRLPNAEWCYDQNRDAMTTFLSGMRAAQTDPAVHMEEDILLCDGFVPRIEEQISLRPNCVIQFFSMRKDDLTIGSRWDRRFMMNQCFYLPAGYSAEIADYWERWPKRETEPNGYDILISDWLNMRKEPYWIHVPSLVQHRECRSAIDSRRSSKRQSQTFIPARGEESLT